MFIEPMASIWNHWNQVDRGPCLRHGFSRGCAQEHLSGRTSPTFRSVGEEFFLIEGWWARRARRHRLCRCDEEAADQQQPCKPAPELPVAPRHVEEADAAAGSSGTVEAGRDLCLRARPFSGVGSVTRPYTSRPSWPAGKYSVIGIPSSRTNRRQ